MRKTITKDEIVEEFISSITLTKSAATVSAYERDLKFFLDYMVRLNIKSFKSLRSTHVVNYLGEHKRKGKSNATLNRYTMALRSFFKYARRRKLITDDPMEQVESPKVTRAAPRVPSIEQIRYMLGQPDVTTEAGIRDRAVLELLYSSGLRASELCDLTVHQVTEIGVTVSCGKGGKTRTVPITRSAYDWIKRYIQEYRGPGSGPLFLTEAGKQLTRTMVFKIVSRHAINSGMIDVSPHTLRHACATHLLGEGADIRMIQELLGHSSIAATQWYTHLTSSKIRTMFDLFHPGQRETDAHLDQQPSFG